MLAWAALFFVVALVAAIFGFGGIAASAAGLAKVFFILFGAAFLISLAVGRFGNRRRVL